MAIHPLAGKPAPKELLIDVAALERAYYERRPNPSDPAQLVSFGTSGHRGTALDGTFTFTQTTAPTLGTGEPAQDTVTITGAFTGATAAGTLVETTTFADAERAGGDEEKAMLVELRSTGAQTVFPPSVHPSGEVIGWSADGDAAPVDGRQLHAAEINGRSHRVGFAGL